MRVVLLATALLAGCSGSAPETVASPTPSPKPTFQSVLSGGWADVWTTPQPVLDALGRLSFRPSPYKATGGRYRSETRPAIVLADPASGEANSFAVGAEGTAERLDTLSFVLSLTDQGTADTAKARFVEQLQMAFRQLGVPGGDAVAAPITAETPADGEADGARWSVARKPLTGNGRQLIVTFTAPDATGIAS